MKIDLKGKTAVITGASRGLGEAMAHSLADAGAQVALVARDLKRLELVKEAITARGGSADVFAGDVTREDEVASLVPGIAERFGAPQIVINNAA